MSNKAGSSPISRALSADSFIRGVLRTIEIPELDGFVHYRPMTAGAIIAAIEREEEAKANPKSAAANLNHFIELVADHVVTPDGEQMFTTDQLRGIPADLVTALGQGIVRAATGTGKAAEGNA